MKNKIERISPLYSVEGKLRGQYNEKILTAQRVIATVKSRHRLRHFSIHGWIGWLVGLP